MKTTITTDRANYVTISYNSVLSGERITRSFFCPPDGGYVRELDKAQQFPQVCEKLSDMGSALTSPSRDKLVEVIRHEYRAMRRAEAREAARY